AFRSAETAANSLTEEFLQSLRSSHELIPDDDIDVAIHVDRQRVVTPDYIVAAQMLAAALGPHFHSLDDIAKSSSFIAMPVRDANEGYLLTSVLKATLLDSFVTVDPRFAPDRRRFIVFMGSGPASFERMTVIKMAAKQGYSVLWLYDCDGEV